MNSLIALGFLAAAIVILYALYNTRMNRLADDFLQNLKDTQSHFEMSPYNPYGEGNDIQMQVWVTASYNVETPPAWSYSPERMDHPEFEAGPVPTWAKQLANISEGLANRMRKRANKFGLQGVSLEYELKRERTAKGYLISPA